MIKQFELIQKLKVYHPDLDEDLINRAYVYAMKMHGSQMRASGDPYFSHPVEVASILADLRLDAASIATGLLHDTVEDTGATLEEIEKLFGLEVAKLVDGVTKLTRLELQSEETKQAENFRKLVLAMSSDIRVLLVKLADRLHNMRTLYHIQDERKRRRVATETKEIYIPLAERMGMHGLKDELEDIAFATLNPEARESIQSRLRYLHETSSNQTEMILLELRKLFEKQGMEVSLSGREKTPHSIWKKMHDKNIPFDQLTDIMAFRVVVDTIPNCYQALGILHHEYSLVPGRFKDYISTPKSNGYESLHTAIIGPLNQRIEVQIRTKEMHDVAELGVAAHWQYKQGFSTDGVQYAWLRGLLEILDHASTPEEFLEHTKLEMFQDQVFCFTPKGDVIALPRGATPVDMAYAIHSHIGNHTVAARINGRQMPLRTILHNGDQIEIITSKSQTPSPTWERFVVTGKARSAIRKFIRQQQKNQFLELGKSLFHKALNREGIFLDDALIKLACEMTHSLDLDDLYVNLGQGGYTARDVAHNLHQRLKQQAETLDRPHIDEESDEIKLTKKPKDPKKEKQQTLSIKGLIPGMALHYAGCCHPIPGDRIVGVVITGKGIHIHTKDCDHIHHVHDPERILDLEWNDMAGNDARFTARVLITFINKSGALATITTIISKQQGNISNLKVMHRSSEFWDIFIDVEVRDQDHLSSVIASLRTSSIISSVERGK